MRAEPAKLPRIEIEDVNRLLHAERAVLVVADQACPRCRAYERELIEHRRGGELEGVEMAVLQVDGTESPVLPYTLLFSCGQRIHSYGGGSGARLLERFGRSARTTRPTEVL